MAASVSRDKSRQEKGSRVYLRLARFGPRGEGGVARYHSKRFGKLYKRDGIYPVDEEQARLLLATGVFEQLQPGAELEAAKKVAKTPRGASIEERSRRQRAARARRRPSSVLEEAAAAAVESEGDQDGLEL